MVLLAVAAAWSCVSFHPPAFSGDGISAHFIDVGQGGARLIRTTGASLVRHLRDIGVSSLAHVAAAWSYVSFLPPAFSGDGISVHFIDVGQGDATLIRTAGGDVLIDGGDRRAGASLVRYLRDVGVSSLAYVVATHPHADHIGGLEDVFDGFDVGTVIMPRVAHTTVTFERFIAAIERNDIPVMEPVVGNVIGIGGATMTILAPGSRSHANLNNHSVAMIVSYGRMGFMFTGDAEDESEAEMVAGSLPLSAQVLRVGHHGSRTSTTQAFLDAVSPRIAVISVGAGNPFGHPHREVMQRLEAAGITVYRTDRDGTIVISTDGATLTVN